MTISSTLGPRLKVCSQKPVDDEQAGLIASGVHWGRAEIPEGSHPVR